MMIGGKQIAVGFLIAAACVWINAALVLHSDGSLPDSNMTPGLVRTTDKNIICNTKTGSVRNVTEAMKASARRRYNMSGPHDSWCSTTHGCEIDHLIPLELGGDNGVENLWPQPYDGLWNAHVKDQLENKLHSLVCDAGTMEVETAQQAIRSNWIEAYKTYVNATPLPPKAKKKS